MNHLRYLLPILLWLTMPTSRTFSQCIAHAPANFVSTPISNTSTKLSWNQVSSFTQYRLTVETDSGLIILNNVLVNGTSRTVTGLNTNSTYLANVRVQCSTGNVSSNVSWLGFSICLLPAPTHFEGTVLPGAPPLISWTWDTMPGAIGYQLKVTDLNTGIVQTFNPMNPFQTTDAILGHTYSATVASKCANGGISPYVSLRTVKVIIIDEVVQYNGGNCGFEDANCPLSPNSSNPTYNISKPNDLLQFQNITFLNGETRKIYKFKIWDTAINPPPTSAKYVEFKLAFEPNSGLAKFKQTAASAYYSVIRQYGSELYLRKTNSAGTVATDLDYIRFANFLAASSTTSFQLDITRLASKGMQLQYWLCKTCSLPPSLGGDDDIFTDEITLNLAPHELTLAVETFPNPTNDAAIFRFQLPEEQAVTLTLFDAAGKIVREFITDEWHEAGTHELEPDISKLPPGVYRCVLRTEMGTQNCSMVKM